eukprot:326352_1
MMQRYYPQFTPLHQQPTQNDAIQYFQHMGMSLQNNEQINKHINIISEPTNYQNSNKEIYGAVFHDTRLMCALNKMHYIESNDIFNPANQMTDFETTVHKHQQQNYQLINGTLQNGVQYNVGDELITLPFEYTVTLHNMCVLVEKQNKINFFNDLFRKTILGEGKRYALEGFFLRLAKKAIGQGQWKKFIECGGLQVFKIRTYEVANIRINWYTNWNRIYWFYSNQKSLVQSGVTSTYNYWRKNDTGFKKLVKSKPLESFQFDDNKNNFNQNENTSSDVDMNQNDNISDVHMNQNNINQNKNVKRTRKRHKHKSQKQKRKRKRKQSPQNDITMIDPIEPQVIDPIEPQQVDPIEPQQVIDPIEPYLPQFNLNPLPSNVIQPLPSNVIEPLPSNVIEPLPSNVI